MKKGNPVAKIIIGIIMAIMLCFFAYTIFRIVYKAGKGTDFAYIDVYSTFINAEDNLAPDYKTKDLIILKYEDFYTPNQVVVFKENEVYRLGLIKKTSTSKYYIATSNDKTEDKDLVIAEYKDIAGSVYKNLGKIGKIFEILSSTAAAVVTVIIFFLYVMFSKEA